MNKDLLKLKVLEIFKNHDIITYEIYKDYIKTSMNDTQKNKKIYDKALKLYLKALPKDNLKALKSINITIQEQLSVIESHLLSTVEETCIIDQPKTLDNNWNEIIRNRANVIALRDKNGFYSLNSGIQKELNNFDLPLGIIHNALLNKEEIMNGNAHLKKCFLNRGEIIVLANFLGYASVREKILLDQEREKVKQKIKI